MRIAPALALGAVLLAGCAGDDLSRPGTWAPAGLNEANLRAMLVDPAHAVRGVAAEGERAQPAVRAARALDAGRRAPLPESNVSRVGRGSAPAAAGAGQGGGDAR